MWVCFSRQFVHTFRNQVISVTDWKTCMSRVTSNLSQGVCAWTGWHTKWRSHMTDEVNSEEVFRTFWLIVDWTVFVRSCLVSQKLWTGGLVLWPLWTKEKGHSPLLGLEPGSRVSRDQKQGSHWVHVTKGCGEREENVNTGCVVLTNTVQHISIQLTGQISTRVCLYAVMHSLKLKQKSRMHISVYYSLLNT